MTVIFKVKLLLVLLPLLSWVSGAPAVTSVHVSFTSGNKKTQYSHGTHTRPAVVQYNLLAAGSAAEDDDTFTVNTATNNALAPPIHLHNHHHFTTATARRRRRSIISNTSTRLEENSAAAAHSQTSSSSAPMLIRRVGNYEDPTSSPPWVSRRITSSPGGRGTTNSPRSKILLQQQSLTQSTSHPSTFTDNFLTSTTKMSKKVRSRVPPSPPTTIMASTVAALSSSPYPTKKQRIRGQQPYPLTFRTTHPTIKTKGLTVTTKSGKPSPERSRYLRSRVNFVEGKGISGNSGAGGYGSKVRSMSSSSSSLSIGGASGSSPASPEPSASSRDSSTLHHHMTPSSSSSPTSISSSTTASKTTDDDQDLAKTSSRKDSKAVKRSPYIENFESRGISFPDFDEFGGNEFGALRNFIGGSGGDSSSASSPGIAEDHHHHEPHHHIGVGGGVEEGVHHANPESLSPDGVFLPPLPTEAADYAEEGHGRGGGDHGHGHDPYVADPETAKYAAQHPPFFAAFPHKRTVLDLNERRIEQGLEPNILRSIRPFFAFFDAANPQHLAHYHHHDNHQNYHHDDGHPYSHGVPQSVVVAEIHGPHHHTTTTSATLPGLPPPHHLLPIIEQANPHAGPNHLGDDGRESPYHALIVTSGEEVAGEHHHNPHHPSLNPLTDQNLILYAQSILNTPVTDDVAEAWSLFPHKKRKK